MRRSLLEYAVLLVAGLVIGVIYVHYSSHPARYSGVAPVSAGKLLPGRAVVPASGIMEPGTESFKLENGNLTALLHYQDAPRCPDTLLLDHVGDMIGKDKPCHLLQLTLIASVAPASSDQDRKAAKKLVYNVNLAAYAPSDSSLPDIGTVAGTEAENHQAPARYATRLSLIGLDPQNPVPQVLVGGYSGGVHCCEVTRLLWLSPDHHWMALHLPDQDGGTVLPLSFVPHMAPVFVFNDQNFLYTFASYNGSYQPPVLLRFQGGRLEDVSSRPGYRPLLLANLDVASRSCTKKEVREPNGYLAYYVAMLARLGHFHEAMIYAVLHQSITPQLAKDMAGIEVFPRHLRDILLQGKYITQTDYDSAPLRPEQLSASERARFSPVGSLFSMLPEGNARLSKEAISCISGNMAVRP